MRRQSCAGALYAGFAVPLLLAGLLAGPGPAAVTAACQSRPPSQPRNPSRVNNGLNGVTMISACNVWVVGHATENGVLRALIEHWNGSAWKVVRSPSPGKSDFLSSVDALSPADIWAVGQYVSRTGHKTLILHWNGIRWRQVPSPSPGRRLEALTGVAAVSAADAWAVGLYGSGSGSGSRDKTLILHWNGKRWARAASPSPAPLSELTGVTAASARDVWAVGDYAGRSTDRTLILHWNGRRWSRVTSPNPVPDSQLRGVTAISARDAWAVGSYFSDFNKNLVLHWNGVSWRRVPAPNLINHPNGNLLLAVAAVSARNVWAIGAELLPFALRWDGSRWRVGKDIQQAFSSLSAVAADRAGDVWAVGGFLTEGSRSRAFAIRLR
jgi:hypothetical protein